jgi:hypothetical protein
MPDLKEPSVEDLMIAREMLEYCRFIYKAYAQTLAYPMDPFYESHGKEGLLKSTRKRVMKLTNGQSKFDPIEYIFHKVPDPRQGVVYRAGVDDEYILFQPRHLDKKISVVGGIPLEGEILSCPPIKEPEGQLQCWHFQGRTGMTKNHPDQGWPSWLGAVIYDHAKKTCVIVFRGSRSGSASRAFLQAQAKSTGNPDWVTDMNHWKEIQAEELTLACGFWLAYESCTTSLREAYKEATQGETPECIFVTGHSLGGALAQCAYLDIMAEQEKWYNGDPNGFFNKSNQLPECYCYPISAPPVLLSKKSCDCIPVHVRKRIFHYFCQYDAVHDSEKIKFSAHELVSILKGILTHLRKHGNHVGFEFSLPSATKFPDAHEPAEVWNAINTKLPPVKRRGGVLFSSKQQQEESKQQDITVNNTTDSDNYWVTFKFKHMATSNFIEGLPDGLEDELKAALRASISAQTAWNEAQQWLYVANRAERIDPVYADALAIMNTLDTFPRGDPKNARVVSQAKARKNACEKALLFRLKLRPYYQPDKYCASSSWVWVIFQYLTAAQFWLGFGLGVQNSEQFAQK